MIIGCARDADDLQIWCLRPFFILYDTTQRAHVNDVPRTKITLAINQNQNHNRCLPRELARTSFWMHQPWNASSARTSHTTTTTRRPRSKYYSFAFVAVRLKDSRERAPCHSHAVAVAFVFRLFCPFVVLNSTGMRARAYQIEYARYADTRCGHDTHCALCGSYTDTHTHTNTPTNYISLNYTQSRVRAPASVRKRGKNISEHSRPCKYQQLQSLTHARARACGDVRCTRSQRI